MAFDSNPAGDLSVWWALSGLCLELVTGGYRRTLETGVDCWWLRGARGRRRGAAMLHLLFSLGARYPARADARMAAEAAAKAAALSSSSSSSSSPTIVFAGSSTFTFWLNLERDVRAALGGGADAPRCVNAGFGGASTRHVLATMGALVLAHRPAVVVYFAGTNDINMDAPPPSAVDNFAAFVARLRESLPAAHVVYLEPTVTPFVRARGAATVRRFEELAAAARALAAASGGAVESVATPAFAASADAFLGDLHHLRPESHAELARALAPAIQRALAAAGAATMATR